ncbi:hypothetical protein [Budvicia aquatica]|uniref:Uncharacterized protein n=1 Tax=Budvicia aquatica TaxID=82979 RepID=A0A2C6DMS3_9GAMM|nr:hypothetical protein [Budvicia aquatica]PHI29735.1 hypothetical protein CRN84_10495 [Budvicia aquatica]VFS48133.1 Uncharacterised protein [Budvicia aquatica]
MRTIKILLLIAIVLPWAAFGLYVLNPNKSKVDGLKCSANINLYLSDGFSEGPIIQGVIAVNLNKNDENGFFSLSGVVEWQGVEYPVSKLISVKYKNNDDDYVSFYTVNSISLEHDKSPPNVIETFVMGNTSQPLRIFKLKKIYDNAYIVSNFNSPVTICIER